MADDMKIGARHSAKDQEIIKNIRLKAREIDAHALALGADPPPQFPIQPGKADLDLETEAPTIWGVVKASATPWELDVLGIPYGDADNKDSDGEFFDAKTQLHEDKFALPPAVYYHGFGTDKKPMGAPEYIGKTVKRWRDAAGEWFRVVLDKTNAYAQRVWDAAQKGVARASSGSISHLVRYDQDGHIREWPVVELSIFDAVDGRQPANRYAVAVPVAKAIYKMAGIDLPDFAPEAEAEDGSPSPTAEREAKKSRGGMDMEANEIQKLIADGVAAAFKSQAETAAAEAKMKADTDAVVAAAVKAEHDRLEAEWAKSNRLPLGSAHIRKYSTKFDNLDLAEHAFVIGVMTGPTKLRIALPSDEIVKALALKCESEASKNGAANEAWAAIKGAGLKSDEVMYSTLSSYGDEWVGVLYSRNLWERIRAECWVLDKLQPYADQIPDGYESDYVPLESTDPTWYKVPQATATTSGRPDVTITSSQFTTADKSAVAMVKMGCRVLFSGELSEDSLVAIAPNAVRQMKLSALEQFEHALIDGDTATAGTTNINDIGGTPANTEVFTLVNGFRKLALVTNPANSRSGGALGDDDFIETVKMLGVAGINADVTKCQFITDMPTYWKALQMASVKTKDVFTGATMENGQLTGIWGYPLKPSAFMHYMSTARLSNTAGKVDQDTVANNVCGSILAVRWDQWKLKWKRQMTIETDRYQESDTNQITAMVRWGLGYRDTEASAVTYGITGV